MESFTITLQSGRTVTILEGCGRGPMHFPWLGNIAPDYGVIIGGCEDEAHETLADAIDFHGIDMSEMDQLTTEMQEDDPELSDDDAWMQAADGYLDLNGGESWISPENWGFWSPTRAERDEIKQVIAAMQALDDASWICQDCLMAIANGDLPEDPAEIDRPWLRLDEIPSTWVVLLDPTDSGRDCRGFSWSQCDCCGSRLGGSRHAAVEMPA